MAVDAPWRTRSAPPRLFNGASSILLAVTALVLMTLVAQRAEAAPVGQLVQGQALRSGESLVSPSGRYVLTMQADGDAVVTGPGRRLWSSGTSSAGPGATLVLQSDGNLVVYSASSVAAWASGTAGMSGASLRLADTGVLELSSAGKPVWVGAPNVLRPGDALSSTESMYSANLRYRLLMQPDGNLVLYGPTRAIWSSGTYGSPGNRLALQADGNLVVYNVHDVAVFNTGTHGRAGTQLQLGSDSWLVLTSGGSPVWSASAPTIGPGTTIPAGEAVRSPDGAVALSMQEDGNLVVSLNGAPLWNSGTRGTVGASAIMQEDGNLVVYSATGVAAFNTETAGHRSSSFTVQDDGNAVVYTAAGGPVWSSVTGDVATGAAVQAAVNTGGARGERAAVAVYDRRAGRFYVAGDADSYYASASVMKVFIATRLLVTGQAADPTISALMWKMITLSDDNAANTLYGIVGGAGVAPWAAARYGVSGIAATPQPSYWGLTQITARAMVTYYNAVANDPTVGPWLLNAMANMQTPSSDGWPQQFGIPSVTSGWRVKQGWMCCLDGVTRIHSTGFVGQDRYTVAILTQGGTSAYGAYGNDTVTLMAQALLPNGAIPL
ncbi:MAG: mannose-binding lectin [Pseudonocardiales bacterium]|nr:mannose-binding lectin [Pseudonocardiales bacterium]